MTAPGESNNETSFHSTYPAPTELSYLTIPSTDSHTVLSAPTAFSISDVTAQLHDLKVTGRTFSSFTLTWAAQDEVFDQFFITLKDLPSLNRTLEIFLPGSQRETEFTNLTAGTQYQINLHGSAQGQLSQSLEAITNTGIFLWILLAICSCFCFEMQGVMSYYCSIAEISGWLHKKWLPSERLFFVGFFAWDKTLVALE